jgi:hypothetical protein
VFVNRNNRVDRLELKEQSLLDNKVRVKAPNWSLLIKNGQRCLTRKINRGIEEFDEQRLMIVKGSSFSTTFPFPFM